MNQTRWQEIIAQLKEKGWTQNDIADYCGVSQAAINQLKLGDTKEPRYSIGKKLIKLSTLTKSPEEMEIA